MSKKHKLGRFTPSPAPAPGTDVVPEEREQVQQLIAAGKSVPALDLAKEIHKRRQSTSSQNLVLDAYSARLAWFMERQLDRDAAALLDLVRARYPAARERLKQWDLLFAARKGDLGALLTPLQDASLTAEQQATIAAAIRRNVLDLRALSESTVLPPDHPLRTAAAALSKAFDAVTTGPVTEETIALPEVSRSSPLAPWKLLIRAIAAFYRREDALCEKFLAAIDTDSAPSRLIPALRGMIAHSTSLSGAAALLARQVGKDLEALRSALKGLDTIFKGRPNHPALLQAIRGAVAASAFDPVFLTSLKQHLAVRATGGGVPPDKVSVAMGGPARKNASFWRLLARFSEEVNDPQAVVDSCGYWEEFRKHAVNEGWFPDKGIEVATLYLHMADRLQPMSDELPSRVLEFQRDFPLLANEYLGQPPEIRAFMPDRRTTDFFFLDPSKLLERACQADPRPENFQRWITIADEASPPGGDHVAEVWSEARPTDIPPLLRLMQSAESRNALQKAFKLMERAEAVDGLNVEVRRARLRLLVAIAIRHLREKKLKLAEKDLAQIKALPQAQQGDRPALMTALRYALCFLRNDRQGAAEARGELVQVLGDAVTSQLLLMNLEQWIRADLASVDKTAKPDAPFLEAYGRICAIGEDMGLAVPIIDSIAMQITVELNRPGISSNPRYLSAAGEAAMKSDYFPVAYLISGAGLKLGPENQARFLFLRARCMPPWESDRCSDCLTAASQLARRYHDSELLRQISEWRQRRLGWLDVPNATESAFSPEELRELIDDEIRAPLPNARGMEKYKGDFDEDDGEFDDDFNDDEHASCPCPACQAKRGKLPAELADMFDQLGPEGVAKALAQLIGNGPPKGPSPPKKGPKRKSRPNDFDLPF